MKTKKIDKQTQVTTSDFEDAIEKYVNAEKREREIQNIIEEEINEVLEKHSLELELVTTTRKNMFEKAQRYCNQQKDALFNKRRSIATLHGLAGFRLGKPRLKTEKGSNWNLILDALKQKLPAYIRTIEEPAKDLLLAHRNTETVAPVLVELGIEVVQDELFYIETKKAA